VRHGKIRVCRDGFAIELDGTLGLSLRVFGLAVGVILKSCERGGCDFGQGTMLSVDFETRLSQVAPHGSRNGIQRNKNPIFAVDTL
jgi:hypothetical protein